MVRSLVRGLRRASWILHHWQTSKVHVQGRGSSHLASLFTACVKRPSPLPFSPLTTHSLRHHPSNSSDQKPPEAGRSPAPTQSPISVWFLTLFMIALLIPTLRASQGLVGFLPSLLVLLAPPPWTSLSKRLLKAPCRACLLELASSVACYGPNSFEMRSCSIVVPDRGASVEQAPNVQHVKSIHIDIKTPTAVRPRFMPLDNGSTSIALTRLLCPLRPTSTTLSKQ